MSTQPNSARGAWIVGVAIAGIALLLGPAIYRIWVMRVNERAYSDAVSAPIIANQPLPTATPFALGTQESLFEPDLRTGPVVVDFAHFNQVNAAGLQPLAAALARRGVATRIWLSNVDPFALEGSGTMPDQSEALRAQLADASAMIVISPYLWWQRGEIDLLERFVADGGRLLMISDPDIEGDSAVYMNLLAERFGIVYNDDYLYDTTRNDQNYTHFFLDGFADLAASLANSTIAMYGGRSISGDVTTEARSAPTTLSSRRTGVSGFTTVAIGGDSGRGTTGRVLALSDFDVLTEPNVVRFDNQRLVDFTADFLAAAQRTAGVADFPASLGKHATLLIGTTGALNADTLLLGARLQRRFEETGRTLTLAGAPQRAEDDAISDKSTGSSPLRPPVVLHDGDLLDRVVLSDYDYANDNTSLLQDAGVSLITELVTPTVAATAVGGTVQTPSSTSIPEKLPLSTPTPSASRTPDLPTNAAATPDATAVSSAQAATVTVAVSPTLSVTAGPTTTLTATATATPQPTPFEVDYLVAEDGMRLLAAETVLVIHIIQAGPADGSASGDQPGHAQISVIGADNAGISAGVDRLLENDFSDCIVGEVLTWCPVAASASARAASSAPATPAATLRPPVAGTPTGPMRILLVDDDVKASAGERSEADTWLKTLTAAGYTPDLWSTAQKGTPDAATLSSYKWLIWSNGGYVDGNLDVSVLDPLFAYLGEGGRISISSRRPFFNMSASTASPIVDVVVAGNIPNLVAGLPSAPIGLAGELGNVIPLQEAESGSGFATLLTRGPASSNSGSPAASAGTDANEPDAVGARLIIVGFSTTWLPSDVADRFIRNMADWILSTEE